MVGFFTVADERRAYLFAGHAKLDPSGTSWLPFPFWATGTVMKVLDPSLDVARLAAWLGRSGVTSFAEGWWKRLAGRISPSPSWRTR